MKKTKLKWTKKLPTVDGFYLWRYGTRELPCSGLQITPDGYATLEKMCRNAYNAGLMEGKKKRPRAVKP